MRFVMFGENESAFVLFPQSLPNLAWHVELLSQPDRHRLSERTISKRCVRKICFQQSLKFSKWLVIESDIVQLIWRQSGCCETIIDRILWKSLVVFLASEAFLLRRGNDFPIDD